MIPEQQMSNGGIMINRIGSTAQRLKELPYEKRVCRTEYHTNCIDPQTGESGVRRASIEEEVNAWADAGVEVWVISGLWGGRGVPSWPSKMLEPLPDAEPERISRFLDLCHEKGIIVLSYYPFTFTKQLVNIHPEWMIQMLDDGKPDIENEGWFCVNSPYRKWLPEYLKEMLDNLDFDGIFFDDTNWGSHSAPRHTVGCCCKYCQELYLKETGKQLPVKVDRESLDFRHFMNWRYDKWLEGIEHITQNIHTEYPHAIIDWYHYGGCARGTPDFSWEMGQPLNPLPGTSYFFSRAALIEGPTFAVKRFKASAPTFGVWIYERPKLPECDSLGAPYPEPSTPTIFGLSAVAHGGAAIAPFLKAGRHTAYGDVAKSVFTELKTLRPYVGNETVKYLALHCSQQTRDFGYYKDPDSFWRQMRGSCEMLTRSQILTDVVFDKQLTYENLDAYKVLMLSDSKCLSNKQIDAIRFFVSNGGTLIATYETSIFDELGRRRDNFGLADVLGVEFMNPSERPTIEPATIDPTKGNLYVPQDKSLQDNFGYIVAFAADQADVSIITGSGAKALFTKSNLHWKNGQAPLNDFYAYNDYDSGLPAVTVNTFGKGRAIYLCGNVGAGFDLNPLTQLKRFVAYFARLAKPPIEVETPSVIEVTATKRNPNEISIHLLNNPWPFVPWEPGQYASGGSLPSDESFPPSIENALFTHLHVKEVLPVHNIVIKINGFKVMSASLPIQGKDLQITDNPVSITVPKVGIQEVVLLQLAQ